MYSANVNASSPVGTIQSIEHTLRNLDKLAVEQQARVARIEKELADYAMQCDRPFEHEQRLRELLARQSELRKLLDLDSASELEALIIEQIYDSALLVEGLHPDPSSMASRVQQIIEAALNSGKTQDK